MDIFSNTENGLYLHRDADTRIQNISSDSNSRKTVPRKNGSNYIRVLG
jgi:hypothetical protein